MRNAKGEGGSKIVRKAWGKGRKLGGGEKGSEEGLRRKKGGKKEGRLGERKQGKRKAWRK